MLDGRRILLGVSGGVAAYKAAYLARRLVERGAEVRVIMTAAAEEFLGAQTMAALTGHAPYTRLFRGQTVSPHTELARWAEVMVVAPATARTMAALANGLSDELLAATLLATRSPVLLAPAMHTEMWEHPATMRNVAQLIADGHHLVGPQTGGLAGGDVGIGRMAEPEEIVAAIEPLLATTAEPAPEPPPAPHGELIGQTVVVTAGGTREPIDPVRYVGNRSSGKMGHAIAAEAAWRGAAVVLVTSAPVRPALGNVHVVAVETAEQMAEAVARHAPGAAVAIMAAAVADFRPKAPADAKLRRADGPPHLVFEPTPDVLGSVAALPDRPFLVGFAAEAGAAEGAVEKATSKGVDLLVANDITKPGSGFGTDTNQVTLITPDGVTEDWVEMPKAEVARRLWDRIGEMRRGEG